MLESTKQKPSPEATVQLSYLCSNLHAWVKGTVARVLFLCNAGASLQPRVIDRTPTPRKSFPNQALTAPPQHPDQGQ